MWPPFCSAITQIFSEWNPCRGGGAAHDRGMSWAEDEDKDEQQARLQRELERRRKQGAALIPVEVPKSTKLARQFWGQAWQRHLESYADYESRLPRGRSYLRQGHVFDLAINEGLVTALVTGQTVYEVQVKIKPLSEARWQHLQSQCAGRVSSLLDLLAGKLGDEVMKIITDPNEGLFPQPKEIKVICTCPDWADLCKHAAAVLYGIGLRFDAQPELFFKLRGVDHSILVDSASSALDAKALASDAPQIASDDLADVFGIDLG